MAPINGRPFLELLLKQLRRYGFRRVILSVGYKHDVIRSHFGESALGLELIYSIESSPLGTGGALRQAADHITRENLVALNGDSYTDCNIAALVDRHNQVAADATLVVAPETRDDGGSVLVGDGDIVTAFVEKRSVAGRAFISAGVYALRKDLALTIAPAIKISIEESLFPQWLAEGKKISAFRAATSCIDIGTPDRYRQAQDLLRNIEISQDATEETRS
jgi:NDP-sugar pyrophosphorylase family protein